MITYKEEEVARISGYKYTKRTIKAAGSTMGDELWINYDTACGNISIKEGISIGGVVFQKDDIIKIANEIKKRRRTKIND